MHVISRRSLREYWEQHPERPDLEQALKAWFYEARNARWQNSAQIKENYRSASIINNERVVFNICGNRYRLVVRVNYTSGTVFIRFIGTHNEYDNIDVEMI